MYLDFLVKVPTVKGKITRRKKSNVVYIEYEYDRVYDPSRKYTFPKRVTIGKLSDTDPELMKPNQNFLKYFPDAELPESKNRTSRSSCLRVGTYFVLYECAAQAVLGSAKLMLETGKHPGELKDMVCSPAGSTIQAVRVLEEKGFRGAVTDAVITAVEKSRSL